MNPRSVPPQASAERLWRTAMFYLSAAMAALALVDLDAGRWAGALGDAGVACLMLSLLPQFPVIREVLGPGRRPAQGKPTTPPLHPKTDGWSDRVGAAGWMMLTSSFVLRLLGVD